MVGSGLHASQHDAPVLQRVEQVHLRPRHHDGRMQLHLGQSRPVEGELRDDALFGLFEAGQVEDEVAQRVQDGRPIDELDGTFSFLISTKDEIGYAKDRLAAKPMVIYENDDLVAIASEEVSLNRLFPGQSLDTMEPPPGTYRTWAKLI